MFTSHVSFDGFASISNLQASWPSALKNDTGQILKEKCYVLSYEIRKLSMYVFNNSTIQGKE